MTVLEPEFPSQLPKFYDVYVLICKGIFLLGQIAPRFTGNKPHTLQRAPSSVTKDQWRTDLSYLVQ